MQDVHPIRTTAGRILGADRRHIHHHHHTAGAALKCPRCNSLNTKFCYYNNYNLSQPRHFCKNCRRYWTNGGVLRNVPVGGSSRKASKRSKPKPIPKLSTDAASTITDEASGVVLSQNATTEHDNHGKEVLFPPEIDGFESAMNNPDPNPNPNRHPDPLGFGELVPAEEWEEKMQGLTGGGVDPTVRIEGLLQSRESEDALEWQENDQNGLGLGLFDDQAYWTQATASYDHHLHLHQHWSNHGSDDNNVSLFLP